MSTPSTDIARQNNHTPSIAFRIFTFGRFQIDWIDPSSGQATPLPAERLRGQNAATALSVLKALLSRPDRFATRAWFLEQFWPDSRLNSAEERLNDVVSSLRVLLRPKGSTDMLVHFVYGTSGRGAGFRLDDYPKIWCDADAFEWYIKHALLLDQRGQDSTACWERAYLLMERGAYLPEHIYDQWADPRRDYLNGLVRDCVQRWTRLLRQAEHVDEAITRLRSYWLEHPTDEDALRPLLGMLGERERFQEAEEYVAKARAALAEDEHALDERTKETLEMVRAMQIHRAPRMHYEVQIEETRIIEADRLLMTQLDDSLALLSPAPKQPLPLASTQPILSIEQSNFASLPFHYWYVPHLRNPFFTGREDLLSHLYQLLHAEKEGMALTQHALCGLGGVGKTQIVLEYAYRYSEEYQAIFWAKADTLENLFADFLTISRILRLPEQFAEDRSITITAVHQWFQSHEGWLLILDNVDDWALVREFLPSHSRGHILITTRKQASGGLAYGLCVEAMNEEIGALFLLRRAGLLAPDRSVLDQTDADYALAQILVHEVGGLPLALDQAGAYMEETDSSIQEYLDLYQTYRLELLRRRGGLTTDHPESVLTTWQLAFTQIESSNMLAVHILRLCAFLAPDVIPEELLLKSVQQITGSLAPTNQLQLNEATSALLRFSLVRRNGKARTLTIHRLVQAVIQVTMDISQKTQYVQYALQALVLLFPQEIAVENWPQCQRLFPHAQLLITHSEWCNGMFEEVSFLCNQLGYYLREQALYEEAEKFYQKGLALRKQGLGEMHADTAQIYYNLARLYFDTGQYTLSIQFHQQSLAIRENVLPPDDLQIALSLNSLAFTYYTQGNESEEIEQLFLRAIPIYKQAIGLEHPITSHCLSNLALFYTSQKRFTEAEQLLRQVQAIRDTQLPPVHLDTARSLQNLAWLYIFQRKTEYYKEAKKLLERSLDIRRSLLGAEHPQVAISLHNLALLLEAEENFGEAEQLYQRVLVIRQKSLGPTSSKVMLTKKDYANLLRKMGREGEAAVLERDRTSQDSLP